MQDEGQQGASEDAQGQAAPDGASQGPADAGQAAQSDDSKAVIARLNAGAKEWREKFEADHARLTEAEQASMSELEKTKAQLAEEKSKREALEQRQAESELKNAVRNEATKAKAIDPDVVWAMISPTAVEFDDDGNPTNLPKLIAAIKDSKPFLFSRTRGSGDGGAKRGASSEGGMNELSAGQLDALPQVRS